MKLRKVLFILSLIVFLGIAACGGNDDNKKEETEEFTCQHSFSENYQYDEIKHWNVCKKCDTKLVDENHNFLEWKVVVEATEDSSGLMRRECSVCSFSEEKIIDKLEHVCNYKSLIVDPTCQEDGYTLYSCECGKSYKDDFVSKKEHNYIKEIVKEPSCENGGTICYTCSNCESSYEEELAALNHIYGPWKLVLGPTFNSTGLLVKTCEHDESHQIKFELPIFNDSDYSVELITPPTCEEIGVANYDIIVEDEEISFRVELDSINHEYSEWEVLVDPTFETSGMLIKKCKNDESHTLKYELPIINEVDYSYRVELEPTCEEFGVAYYELLVDDYLYSFKVEIELLYHDYGEWEIIEEPTLDSTGLIIKTCKNDKNHKVEIELPKLHVLDYEYEVVSEQTCEDTGLAVYKIMIDNQLFTFDVELEAYGHSYGEWELDVEPTLDTLGILIKKCENDSSHVLEYELPLLNKEDYIYDVIISPTCEEPGLSKYSITYSGKTYVFELELPEIGHDYSEWILNITPTLTNTGLLVKVCNNNPSHILEYELPVLNESNYVYSIVSSSVCEGAGLSKYEITVDDQLFAFEIELPESGHNYGEWDLINTPTLTSPGLLMKTCQNDVNHKVEYTLPILNKNNYIYNVILMATCENVGLSKYEIEVDGQLFSFEVELDALGHNYGELVVVNKPTLTDSGLIIKTCQNDISHKVEFTLPVLSESDYYVDIVEPTCEEAGLSKYEIIVDSQVFTFEIVTDKIGHDYSEWTLITSPTLDNEGLLTKTCNNDFNHVKEYILPSLNSDNYIYNIVSMATCEEAGLETYEINVDNQLFKFEVKLDAFGHDYTEWRVDYAPTLTNPGSLIKLCRNNTDHILEYTLRPLNKDDYSYTLVTEATCDKDGLSKYEIIVDNEVFVFEVELTRIGHDYGEWEVIIEPTLTEYGLLNKTCLNDSTHVAEYQLLPLESINYTQSIIISPTCEETGLKEYRTSLDTQEFIFEVELEPVGHEYGMWELSSKPTTNNTGLLIKRCIRDESHIVNYTLPILNKDEYSYKVTINPTCENTGLSEYTFTIDGQTFIFELELESISHSYGEWNLDTNPTMTENGLLIKTCFNDESHILEYLLPMLNKTDYAYSVVTEPSCEEVGLSKYEIIVDGQLFVFEAQLEAIGHNFGDWVVDLAPTEVSVGSRSRHCSRCNSTTDVTEIPMLPYTDGLEYELNEEGTAYTVKGIGIANTNTLSITPVYNNLPVTKIYPSAFSNHFEFKEVIIPNSIIEIGMDAFSGCNNLEKITLPFIGKSPNEQQYTYFGHIFSIRGDHPQAQTYVPSSLKTVIINGGILSKNAFQDCEYIENISINFALTEIKEYAFYNCKKLSNLDFSDVTNLTTIGDYALYRTNVETFELPVSVTLIGKYAFALSYNLTNVIIPENSKLNVIDDSAFQNCESLNTIDLTKTTNLQRIGGFAFYVTNIETLIVPETITTLGIGAFAGAKIKTLVLPTLFGNTLRYYYNNASSLELTSVTINNDTTIVDRAFYEFTKLESVTYPKINELTSIGDYAFYKCSSLKSFDFENASNLNYIGESAFSNCENLDEANLSNSKITEIYSNSFYMCSTLTSVNLPDTLNKIGRYAFNGCSSLVSFEIASNSTLTRIEDYAFKGCSLLEEIVIPGTANYAGYAIFDGCTSLSKITLPAAICGGTFGKLFSTSYNYIPHNVKEVVFNNGTTLPANYFKDCTSLEKVSIPATFTLLEANLFNNCTSLTTVAFEEDNNISSVYFKAFYQCKSLKNINLQDLTKITIINESCFYDCESLECITIPASVTKIDKYAFAECSNLNYVYFAEGCTITNLGASAFENSDLYEIHFPDGMKSIGSKPLNGNNNLEKLTISYSTLLYNYFGNSVSNIPASLKEITLNFDGSISYYFAQNLTTLEKVIIGNKVKIINDGAFDGCSSLQGVLFVEDSILTTIRTDAFNNCSSLKGFDLPSTVTLFLSSFSNCTSLSYFNFNDANIKEISPKQFYNCSNLTSLVLPQTVTTLGLSCFEGCTNLVSLTTPVIGKGEGYLSTNLENKNGVLGYAFGSDDNSNVSKKLKEIVITGGTKLYNNSLKGISSLETITLPSTITEIGKNSFMDCTGLKTFYYEGVIDNFVSLKFVNQYSNPMYYANEFYIRSANAEEWDYLTEVTIPTTINMIRDYTFYKQTNLTSITIHAAVTNIGKQTFYNCTGLTSLEIPKYVTSIGQGAFEGCVNLESLKVPFAGGSAYTANEIGMGYVFGVDSNTLIPKKLKEITITNPSGIWGLANCLYIEKLVIESGTYLNSLENCESLKEIVLPNTLTTIYSDAFTNCKSLTSLYIPAKVNNISVGDSFVGCDSLVEIIVDENNTTYDSRDNCNAIIEKKNNILIVACKTTVIPSTVKSIAGDAFNDVSGLTEINITEGVTAIYDMAFYNCSDLESIVLPSTLTTFSYYSFYNCGNITSCVVSEDNTKFDSRDNCNAVIITKNNEMIKAFNTQIIPSTVTTIARGAFSYCAQLTSINIPATVTKFNDYFEYCDNLVEVTVDKNNKVYDSRDNCNAVINTLSNTLIAGIGTTTIPDSVTSIGQYAFAHTNNLVSIVIPSNVESLGNYAFIGSKNLVKVEFSENTKITQIPKYAFSGCVSLAYIDLSSGIQSIGEKAFYNCDSLETISLPNTLTTIDTYAFSQSGLKSVLIPEGVVSIGQYAFESCKELINVSLPSTLVTIASYTFNGCESLEVVKLADGLTTIEYRAFFECRSLGQIELPSTLEVIGNDAFRNAGLETIVLPKSVTSLGTNVFTGNNLTAFYYAGDVSDWINITLASWSASPADITGVNEIYFLNENDEFYLITELVIPDGTTILGKNLFYNFNFTSVTLPNSITSIGEQCFGSCNDVKDVYYNGTISQWLNIQFDSAATPLTYAKNFYVLNENGEYELVTEITIPDTVSKIGKDQFYSMKNLTTVTISSSVKTIESDAFGSCNSLKTVYYNGTIEDWCNIYFESNYSNPLYYATEFYVLNENGEYELVTDLIIPEGVTSIGQYQFINNKNITSIIIPASVTRIDKNAFYNCTNLTSVYYLAAEGETNITVSSNNTPFNNAIKYYYSETEPTTTGSYWHYDTDGKTILIW